MLGRESSPTTPLAIPPRNRCDGRTQPIGTNVRKSTGQPPERDVKIFCPGCPFGFDGLPLSVPVGVDPLASCPKNRPQG